MQFPFAAPSTPSALPDCAVPLLFETGIEQAPYAHAGTGFLAVWESTLFLVTAGHCIQKGQENSLVLPLSTSTREVAPLRNYFHDVVASVSAAEEPADIVCYSVESSLRTAEPLWRRATQLPLTFDIESILALAGDNREQIPLTAAGFPLSGTASEIDYEAKTFVSQEARISGRYAGTSQVTHAHCMRVTHPGPIRDINGMSGSPVFSYAPFEGKKRYFFVGMLVRGVLPLAHFASGRLIREVLVEAARMQRGAPTGP